MSILQGIHSEFGTHIATTIAIAVGLVFLMAGARGANRIIAMLCRGKSWKMLRGLIFVFVLGYVAFAAVLNLEIQIPLEAVSAALFLAGGIFVWLVVRNSLETVNDILKVRSLEMMVNTDPLTGLDNRRSLDARLEQELERSRRYDRPCSALMFDVDHFKRINDTRGHDFGDHVLRELGKILKDFHRSTDIVARYGGEEFVAVLAETTESGAVLAAERLRQAIESHRFYPDAPEQAEDGDASPGAVTVSIGVVEYSPVLDSCTSDLIRRADQALYVAKRNGRNQVIVHGENIARVGETTAQVA